MPIIPDAQKAEVRGSQIQGQSGNSARPCCLDIELKGAEVEHLLSTPETLKTLPMKQWVKRGLLGRLKYKSHTSYCPLFICLTIIKGKTELGT